MNSRDYWRKRELAHIEAMKAAQKDYGAEFARINERAIRNIEKEIEAFYGRYAEKEGISISAAKKKVTRMDVQAFSDKAAEYVKNKDFSEAANEALRLYNLTMKVNRLELLKSEIALELVNAGDEYHKYMWKVLTAESEAEVKRQAGILGKTLDNNDVKNAQKVVTGSWKNATFSERIWGNNASLKNNLDNLLTSGIIAGKHPTALARELRKQFDATKYEAERLMRTESSRIQGEIAISNYEKEGITEYEWVAEPSACDICAPLDGKRFKVRGAEVGNLNHPLFPMHPNCVLPETEIIAPDAEAMIRSKYSGDVIEIRTSNGTRLSVTPNHIMLTARGWVRAKNLTKGDKVICYAGGRESMVEADPADYDGIPTAEQLFTALIKASTVSSFCVPVSAKDLKGDVVENGKVDIVFINSKLRGELNLPARKLISDILLVGTAVSSKGFLPSDCSLAEFLVCTGLAADGIMSGFRVANILISGTLTHRELVSLRLPSDYDARLFETALNGTSANSKVLCNEIYALPRCIKSDDLVGVNIASLNPRGTENNAIFPEYSGNRLVSRSENLAYFLSRFSGLIDFDDISNIAIRKYSGHVYDISSQSTLYISNGIITSNCRCAIVPSLDREEYEAWLNHIDRGV